MAKRIDWIKAKKDYIVNNLSLRDISEKYKVSLTAVFKHSKEEEWVKAKELKRSEIETKVLQKSTELEIDKKTRANQEHIEAYDDVLNLTKKVLAVCIDSLENARNKSKKASSIAYTIDKLATAIEKVQKGQRLALSIQEEESENEMPQINIVKGLDIKKI